MKPSTHRPRRTKKSAPIISDGLARRCHDVRGRTAPLSFTPLLYSLAQARGKGRFF